MTNFFADIVDYKDQLEGVLTQWQCEFPVRWERNGLSQEQREKNWDEFQRIKGRLLEAQHDDMKYNSLIQELKSTGPAFLTQP